MGLAGGDPDPVTAVARDHVAGTAGAATEGGGAGGAQLDAGAGVAQRGCAGGVEPDGVAQHGDLAVGRVDAAQVVARDEVAGTRGRAANGGAARIVEVDAVAGVAQVGAAAGVGADVVALDGDRARGGHPDAFAHVSGDDVALTGCRAADGDVGGRRLHHDAVVAIGGGEGAAAGGVGADVVAADAGAVGAGGQVDVVAAVAGDHVAPGHGPVADLHVGAQVVDAGRGVAAAHARIAAVGIEAADVVGHEGVPVGAGRHVEPIAAEVADHQALDRAAVGRG